MNHYRNASIRMNHARGGRRLAPGQEASTLDLLNDAIERGEQALIQRNWRDAADAFYTAAFLAADDEQMRDALMCRGDFCILRAELAEPAVELQFICEGI